MAARFDDSWLDLPLAAVRESVWSNTERSYLHGLLARNRGRINDTADAAGITTRALYEKMRRYGLRKEDYKRRRRGPGT
jgi:DNA-binding NtrC family response regulator